MTKSLDTYCFENIMVEDMSHVRVSWDMPSFTIKTNGLGVLNIIDVYRQVVPKARFYQA